MIKFNATREESDMIAKIAKRAYTDFGCYLSLMEAVLDLEATHSNGNRLRLPELLEAANKQTSDYVHDILGIYNNIDRRTGKLKNCFQPRFTDYERL
jgi:hypothetical protein